MNIVSMQSTDQDDSVALEMQLRDMLTRENCNLKIEISELKKELDELQDSFRIKDAEEFQRVQMSLDAANKKCRVMQYRITKLEKVNEELAEEKLCLEDYLVSSRENESRLEDLEEELSVAKEVSIRLHKDLECLEQSEIKSKALQNDLINQIDKLHKAYNPSDCQLQELSAQLQEALKREYEQSVKIGELQSELKSVQSTLKDSTECGQNTVEADQKLIILHNYVCRLRQAIDEKDQLLNEISSKENKSDRVKTINVVSRGTQAILHNSLFDNSTDTNTLSDSVDSNVQPQLSSSVSDSFNHCSLNKLDSNSSYPSNSVHNNLSCNGFHNERISHNTKDKMQLFSNESTAIQCGNSFYEKCSKSVYCDFKDSGVSVTTMNENSDKEDNMETKQLRAVIKEYKEVKDQLESSLKEACEILVCKEQELSELRQDRKDLAVKLEQFQNSIETRIKSACQRHTNLVESLRKENAQLRESMNTLEEELRNNKQDLFKSDQERLNQLQELRCLENNYRELGERLNTEVCQLTKQITQLNEDKEQLEANLSKLRNNRLRQPVSRMIVNQPSPTTVGNAKPPSSNKVSFKNDKRKKIQNLVIPCGNVVDTKHNSATPEIRVKLQQHNCSVKQNSSVKTDNSYRNSRAKITNFTRGGQVNSNNCLPIKKTESLNRSTVSLKPSSIIHGSQKKTISNGTTINVKVGSSQNNNGNGELPSSEHVVKNSISTKAHSLISRIRYRSSSTATKTQNAERPNRKDSKLPLPVISKPSQYYAKTEVLNEATLTSNKLAEECNNVYDQQRKSGQEQQRFGEEHMNMILNKATSTSRPLMMNSFDESDY
ncbi:hypothetical protein GJ496_008440 [Pomphorhynchus laevis]|nr:hypothetical protein GJ496_008440 [Pomphorhynchus laevis]